MVMTEQESDANEYIINILKQNSPIKHVTYTVTRGNKSIDVVLRTMSIMEIAEVTDTKARGFKKTELEDPMGLYWEILVKTLSKHIVSPNLNIKSVQSHVNEMYKEHKTNYRDHAISLFFTPKEIGEMFHLVFNQLNKDEEDEEEVKTSSPEIVADLKKKLKGEPIIE